MVVAAVPINVSVSVYYLPPGSGRCAPAAAATILTLSTVATLSALYLAGYDRSAGVTAG